VENKDLGKSSTGMQPNLAALLSYVVGIITGVVFFLIEKENKFVRFHAMQSILTFGFFLVANAVLAFIPVIGWSIMPLLAIVQLIVWILLMVKSYQGELFKLPVVGDIAEKNS
jgi:uncharacterized membrane protein